jgi:hypothetical protein
MTLSETLSRAAMAHPGEVITLQFGGYANWCGAHFWNFQVRIV